MRWRIWAILILRKGSLVQKHPHSCRVRGRDPPQGVYCRQSDSNYLPRILEVLGPNSGIQLLYLCLSNKSPHNGASIFQTHCIRDTIRQVLYEENKKNPHSALASKFWNDLSTFQFQQNLFTFTYIHSSSKLCYLKIKFRSTHICAIPKTQVKDIIYIEFAPENLHQKGTWVLNLINRASNQITDNPRNPKLTVMKEFKGGDPTNKNTHNQQLIGIIRVPIKVISENLERDRERITGSRIWRRRQSD